MAFQVLAAELTACCLVTRAELILLPNFLPRQELKAQLVTSHPQFPAQNRDLYTHAGAQKALSPLHHPASPAQEAAPPTEEGLPTLKDITMDQPALENPSLKLFPGDSTLCQVDIKENHHS